jgi:hypothetical protein
MAGPNIQGTFATASTPITALQPGGSDSLVIPTGTTALRLTVTNLDGSNTVRSQKRTAGGVFVDQTTYNTPQSNVSVPAVAGEEWRLVQVTQQTNRDLLYKLSAES